MKRAAVFGVYVSAFIACLSIGRSSFADGQPHYRHCARVYHLDGESDNCLLSWSDAVGQAEDDINSQPHLPINCPDPNYPVGEWEDFDPIDDCEVAREWCGDDQTGYLGYGPAICTQWADCCEIG